MAAGSAGARLRAVVSGFVAIVLAAVGLLALPASAEATGITLPAAAASRVSVSGTGAESSEPFVLAAGIYAVELSYQGNAGYYGATDFRATLSTPSKALATFADDDSKTGTARRIVQLPSSATMQVDVRVAAVGANWTLSAEKLPEPTTTLKTLSMTGTGADPGALHRLAAGSYTATVEWSGSTATAGFTLALIGKGATKHQLVTGGSVAGTLTTIVTIAATGTYWLSPTAGNGTNWSVQLKLLPSLSATPTPTISGTVRVGKTLTAKPGTWKPSGVTLSYQWYRSGSTIAGATKSGYKLTSKDKSKRITVRVTGRKSGYLSVTKTSKATAAVKK